MMIRNVRGVDLFSVDQAHRSSFGHLLFSVDEKLRLRNSSERGVSVCCLVVIVLVAIVMRLILGRRLVNLLPLAQ